MLSHRSVLAQGRVPEASSFSVALSGILSQSPFPSFAGLDFVWFLRCLSVSSAEDSLTVLFLRMVVLSRVMDCLFAVSLCIYFFKHLFMLWAVFSFRFQIFLLLWAFSFGSNKHFYFYFFTVAHLAWNSLFRPIWLQTYRKSCASASQGLGLQARTTVLSFKHKPSLLAFSRFRLIFYWLKGFQGLERWLSG